MGLALGLAAALSWGFSDFTVALTTRRTPALLVALGFHLAALAPLGVLVLTTDALANVTGPEVAAFVAIGSLGWLSYLFFYRALAIGPISLVSPIVSGYAAVTVVLAVVLLGEHISAFEGAAVLFTFVGVGFASTDVSRLLKTKLDRRGARGIALALAAMVFFGGFVFGVSEHRAGVGWLAPIFLGRAFSAVFLLVHAGSNGSLRMRLPPCPVLGLIGLIAVLDTSGYVFFNLGVRDGSTSVVATASALYALVPVVLGVRLLRERPSRSQWLGLSIACSGVVLLGVAG